MIDYTPRQKRILAKLPEFFGSYDRDIFDSALTLYERIQDEPNSRLPPIVAELTELANNSMFSTELSKPRESFDEKSLELYSLLNTQDDSLNTYSSTITELTRVIYDLKGLKIETPNLEGAVVLSSLSRVAAIMNLLRRWTPFR